MSRKTKKSGGERLVKTLTREELKAKMDRGDDFVLLEALGEASYRRGHLRRYLSCPRGVVTTGLAS